MTAAEQNWNRAKAEYLRQVEKALSAVKHPRTREVLEDVAEHLDRRFAELPPEQQAGEGIRAIFTEMGPPSEYAELLESNGAAVRRDRWRHLLWASIGVVAVVAVVAVVVLAKHMRANAVKRAAVEAANAARQAANARAAITDTFIVTFGPRAPFKPVTAMELLDAFNEKHPPGVRTHHYRTQIENDSLVGYICVDGQVGRSAVLKMLGESEKFIVIAVQEATKEKLDNLYAMKQVSLGADETYIVSFRPVEPFSPQTGRELLDVFNENHPRGVRTHHYRTEMKDGVLVGHICVDTEAGKDAVVSMLEASGKLELVGARKLGAEEARELGVGP